MKVKRLKSYSPKMNRDLKDGVLYGRVIATLKQEKFKVWEWFTVKREHDPEALRRRRGDTKTTKLVRVMSNSTYLGRDVVSYTVEDWFGNIKETYPASTRISSIIDDYKKNRRKIE